MACPLKLDQLSDGEPAGDRWKFTCRLCQRPFLDSVHPSRMTDPICHSCFTGGQKGPAVIYPTSTYTSSHWREAE